MDHNVYILGAGFSAEAGFPLMNQFKERMLEARDWLQSQNRSFELESLDRVLKFRENAGQACEYVNFSPNNIEHLFSLASAYDFSLTEDVCKAIGATLSFSHAEYSKDKQKYELVTSSRQPDGGLKPENRSIYSLYGHYARLFAGRLTDRKTNNTIATFNYDTLLEDGCEETGTEFTYDIDEPAEILPIFKLHGSVNWSQRSVGVGYEAIALNQETPLLLPPTWNKVVNDPKLRNAWIGTLKALKTARRIIIIGFSLPLSDYHFKFLLAAGLMGNMYLKQILIVDPYPERLRDSIESIFTGDAKRLIDYHSGTTSSFLYNPNRLKEVEGIASTLDYGFVPIH